MKKRVLKIMIILTVLLLLLIPTTINAEVYGDLTYEVKDGQVVITDCNTEAAGKIEIPEEIEGYPVTGIADWAFERCTRLTDIIIPDSVINIEQSAFYYCRSLTDIIIPEGVKKIEHNTFQNCEELTNIVIPDGVTVIEEGAFANCIKLMNVKIPENTTKIGSTAFMSCSSLTSISIPESVSFIGSSAFRNCENLRNITIADNVQNIGWSAFDNTSYFNDNTNWENGVLYIGNYLIKAETSLAGEYIIKNGIKCIAQCAFSECSELTSIVIPNSVVEIGAWAFDGCVKLTGIIIPDGCKVVEMEICRGCTNLNAITIPDSVISIGGEAFSDTQYYKNSQNWENDELYIGNHLIAVKSTVSGEYRIKPGTKTIGGWAFYNCIDLVSVVIPDSVISIGENAFSDCKKLKYINISENIKNIYFAAFYKCTDMEYVIIPDSIESIVSYAFYGCTGLETIEIPKSVKVIEQEAFYECTNLKNVKYEGTEAEWQKISIEYYNEDLTSAHIEYESSMTSTNKISVMINGKEISFDQPPIIVNGRTLVPLRAIFEALGAEVNWNDETKTVTAIKENILVKLQINSDVMNVGDEVKYLDVPAKIVNSRTLVPARAIAEAFGCEVNWDDETKTVLISA